MFANRYTAFIDACTLVSVLRRNLLLTLARAEFFRVRWSELVLDETQAALAKLFAAKGLADATDRAGRARAAMERAFADAMVTDFDRFLPVGAGLPDRDDAHVLAAALKTRASVIVTENLRHFPTAILSDVNLEVRSADAFIADTIALDPPRAVPAVRGLRLRLKRPEKTAEALLLDMEAAGLAETVDVLRAYVGSL